MKAIKTPFNTMALALTLSVIGMLLSLSALAIATDNFAQPQTNEEIVVESKSIPTSK